MKRYKKIQTKFNENIITTSNTDEMYRKYLTKPLFRVWTENFLDGDTGEVIPVERNEMIFEKGTYLEEDQLAVINFHLQAGDLSEVTVSDQKRLGVLSVGWCETPIGYMGVFECPVCFEKYRFHCTIGTWVADVKEFDMYLYYKAKECKNWSDIKKAMEE